MDFGEYLAQSRTNPPKFYPARSHNPYADVFARDLNRHLKTVSRWINGDLDTRGMKEAMEFFARTFPGQYSPTLGQKLWRGQARDVFDGSPRSYSYSKGQAEAFAKSQCGWFEKCTPLLVERPVCFQCRDSKAFAIALDLRKLMRQYSDHPYSGEQEVVLLNTRPQGSAKVWEIEGR